MRRAAYLGAIVAMLGTTGGAFLACSATSDNNQFPSGTGGSGGQGSGGNGQGGSIISIDGGTGCASGQVSCSPDFGQVLCDGNVVETCQPGEACANGGCVPACEAAQINKSTVGCDYYTVNPDVTFSAGACFAAFIANTSATPVQITVERDGAVLDASTFARIPSGNGQALTYTPLPNGELPPGEIAILFLAQFGGEKIYTPACPAGVNPAVSAVDAALHGTGIGSSFRIRTSAPVVAYDIFPYGGGRSAITSATLLLPTTAWDTNYIGVAPYGTTVISPDFQSWLQIVAAEDNTQVTISPTYAIVGGNGVPGTGAGQPMTYTINRGQVLQFTQDQELSGSPIQADKPIGVFGGNRCMTIPNGASACDAGHQMIPPVRALGNEYVGVRHRDRAAGANESPPWRIVGAVDGTTLTYEPAAPPGAPATIGTGQVVEFSTSQPFVVRSQDTDHPFYMSAHMTGCSVLGNFSDCPGDPETVNVIPAEQYLNSYVFFTDPTYPETHLVFIRKRGQNGFADVDLDCAGVLGGWQPIDSAGMYEYTYFDLVSGNFEPQGGCDNGRREAVSDAPFTVTVWGWGTAVTGGDIADPSVPGFYSQFCSYAYPAGASVQAITDVVVPPIPE